MVPRELIQAFAALAPNKVVLAKLLAHHFHEGQMRKGENEPYIVHPARIAENCKTETEKCIAWLHDVIEDSECTLDDLKGFFSEEVINGVDALTKVEGDSLKTQLKIQLADTIVQRIKLLDVLDYWQHAKGMSEVSIAKHKHVAETFYLPLAKDIAPELHDEILLSMREVLS